jgi:predicted negative regulator of RcsB-dependent stress response
MCWDRLLDSYSPYTFSEQVCLSFRPLASAITLAVLLLPAARAGQAPASRPATPSRPAAAPVSSDNQFDANLTLFSALAAINAAGYDAGINAPIYANIPIRAEIRAELAKRSIPCLGELKDFYRQHKKASEAADLGQYISFALIADGPPLFELHPVELPEDVAAIKDFSGLLARFYKEANLQDLWQRSQPAYEAVIAQYQPEVLNAVLEANAYTRNPNSGYLGRRFQIYIDLLGAPDQIQVRGYRDNYFVALTPTLAQIGDQIRDTYLAYLLDPLSFKYDSIIEEKKKGLKRFAEQAPALDEIYKNDFPLLLTKSLIKAIDARLIRNEEKRQLAVDRAMSEGFILTGAFADLLANYEKQEIALRLYYPDLIAAIDTGKEQKRLRKVQFVETIEHPVLAAQAEIIQISEAERTLESASGLFEQKDFAAAKKAYARALSETEKKDLHGRAYFGLARIALIEKRPGEARNLFERTLENDPNPVAASWCHYYIGKLALSGGDGDTAKKEFEAVLQIEGASPQAREEAQKTLQEISPEGEKDQ